MTKKPVLSVVAPVFREEGILPEFHRRLKSVLSAMAGEFSHEIIFVNDGSDDGSLRVMMNLRDADPCVKIINLSRNFGHQQALTAGVDHASGDAVITIDSDLQDPPEVIPEMTARWREGNQVVYGVRMSREGETLLKRATASAFYRSLNRLSDTSMPVDAGDFRLMDRSAVDTFRSMKERSRYIRGMIAWIGFRQCGVAYRREPRRLGSTKYTLGKMAKFAVDGVMNFSEKPLYLASYLGALITLCSFLFAVWLLIGKLTNPDSTIRGWTSILLAVFFLGGTQLLAIGVIGQYIGRIYAEIKGRPLYIIQSREGFGEGAGKKAGAEKPEDE
jgi:dolichol-phosphate mannosyltransferase